MLMICLPIPVSGSGLDLNVERQTCGLLRFHAKDRHAPGQARVFAAHGVYAVGYPAWVVHSTGAASCSGFRRGARKSGSQLTK